MKRSGSVLIVLLVFLLSFTVPSFAEILIGNLQDMSGPTSVWSSAVTRGAELAVEQINSEGGVLGKKLVLITYDTKLDVQESINAFQRLVDRDRVVSVVGPPISSIGIALAPIAEESRISIVGSFMDERATTKEDGSPYPFSFLMQPSSTQQAQIMAGYAIEREGLETFAVIYNQANPYSVSLAEPFIAAVEAYGGEVVSQQTYLSTDKDFRTQLARIRNAAPDAVYAPNYIQELTLIVQQARGLGLNMPFLAGLDAAPPFAELAGEAANHVFYHDNMNIEEQRLQDFTMIYEEKFGRKPLNKSFLGYDKVLIIAEAIKIAGSDDPVEIAQAVSQIVDLPGTTGTISISPENHRPYGLSMVIFQIEDGEYIYKERYLPEDLK